MRSSRACVLSAPVVIVAVCLALLAPGVSSGAEPRGPEALWDAYPLKPRAAPRTDASSTRKLPRTVAQIESAGGDFPTTTVLIALAMLGVGVVAGVRWRRAATAPAGPAAPTALRSARARAWDTLAERFDGDPWPGGAEARWRCEIVWVRGYRTSRFRAVAMAPGRGRKHVLASTAPFPWTFKEEPDAELAKCRVPLEELATRLRHAGWESTDPGNDWWKARFVWTRPEPPPEGGIDER
jgi:hypothetical protein